MDQMLSLEFTYRSKTYCALIRTKMNDQRVAYYVTIMNGELERLLYGNHVLIDENGHLRSEPEILDQEIAELKQCITEALCRRLELYGLVN
jgi:hypothetical protein